MSSDERVPQDNDQLWRCNWSAPTFLSMKQKNSWSREVQTCEKTKMEHLTSPLQTCLVETPRTGLSSHRCQGLCFTSTAFQSSADEWADEVETASRAKEDQGCHKAVVSTEGAFHIQRSLFSFDKTPDHEKFLPVKTFQIRAILWPP